MPRHCQTGYQTRQNFLRPFDALPPFPHWTWSPTLSDTCPPPCQPQESRRATNRASRFSIGLLVPHEREPDGRRRGGLAIASKARMALTMFFVSSLAEDFKKVLYTLSSFSPTHASCPSFDLRKDNSSRAQVVLKNKASLRSPCSRGDMLCGFQDLCCLAMFVPRPRPACLSHTSILDCSTHQSR